MILHRGERVYWGAPEVIYLEGIINGLDEAAQTVRVRIDRASPNASHLIGEEVPFAADGLAPLRGDSPAGTTQERNTAYEAVQPMSDAEKIRGAAAAAVHQRYGMTLSQDQRQAMIEQVAQAIEGDAEMRLRIIQSMDQVLLRERHAE
jgi:hypothetical protein